LGEVLQRTLTKVGPEIRAQLAALIAPTTLKIMAGVLAAWVLSHAVGLGEIIDAIVGVAGVVSIGWAVFDGIDHLYEFAKATYFGRSPADFDAAADHLAKAIAILGMQAVLAVLFRGAKRPRTSAGGRLELEPMPKPNTPIRYTPIIVGDASRAAGDGATSFWGDIVVSTRGSATDRQLVLLHEKVHQFLAPKLYFLREYRTHSRAASYVRSSLYRYIDEALAETIARVGVNGFREFFVGVRFPVRQGYMFFMRGGGFEPYFEGARLVPEAAALIYTGTVSGIAMQLRFLPTSPAGHRRR